MKTKTRIATREKQRPRLRVVITRVASDDPLIYDFQMRRCPTEKRVRRAMEAFEKLLRTSTPS
jgi:hypothetical protein